MCAHAALVRRWCSDPSSRRKALTFEAGLRMTYRDEMNLKRETLIA